MILDGIGIPIGICIYLLERDEGLVLVAGAGALGSEG